MLGNTYLSPIPERFRWRRRWARDSELFGNALIDFIKHDLFKTLKQLPVSEKYEALANVVRAVFACQRPGQRIASGSAERIASTDPSGLAAGGRLPCARTRSVDGHQEAQREGQGRRTVQVSAKPTLDAPEHAGSLV
uniref:hypothetical protein n=1 Tax=Corallococcus coralloides TaxID=184914 RepID=UPI000FFEB522|nr:hypothetical protein [Corallococcus coralloides]